MYLEIILQSAPTQTRLQLPISPAPTGRRLQPSIHKIQLVLYTSMERGSNLSQVSAPTEIEAPTSLTFPLTGEGFNLLGKISHFCTVHKMMMVMKTFVSLSASVSSQLFTTLPPMFLSYHCHSQVTFFCIFSNSVSVIIRLCLAVTWGFLL